MTFHFLADTLQLIAATLTNGVLTEDGALEIDPDDAREIQERLQLLAGIGLQLPLGHVPEKHRRDHEHP